MSDWRLKAGDLKRYPHFDPPISIAAAQALATDPDRVAKHSFYPFLRFHRRWKPFAEVGATTRPKVKERPIRYAARADAYIFSYYRHILSERYEAELVRLGLSDIVLAYRRIPTAAGLGGKCNIHHAADAFEAIRRLGGCSAICLDISRYFESLDHSLLKSLWSRLLGVSRLPPDHFKVFEAITNYSVVDKEHVYERLGHYGVKRRTPSGTTIKGYLTPTNRLPRQLCRGSEFREKIAGGNGTPSLIKKNLKSYGIPQGAPISDLLANLYLIDFDAECMRRVAALGGSYRRYSDDILIIAPIDEAHALRFEEEIRGLIRKYGKKLFIKEEKTSILMFTRDGLHQRCRLVRGNQGKNGLEYLGFRFDGRRVYLRDSTVSNFWRKITKAAKQQARSLARRYPDKDAASLQSICDHKKFIERFGRVQDFCERQSDYRKWTFWTYAKRASEIFGPDGHRILRQLRDHREKARVLLNKEIEAAVARRRSA